MFDNKTVLTKELILSKVSEYDIFKKYLGISPKLSTKFRNPLRKDENPGCKFYIDNRGVLKFNDISAGYNWDCFNVVQIVCQCTYGEALKVIARDFDIYNVTIDIDVKKIRLERIIKNKVNFKKKIEIKIGYWTYNHKEYWNQYYIDHQDLRFFNVFPVEIAWINGNMVYDHKKDDICFAYYFDNDDFKLYFPYRKKDDPRPRFIHNNPDIIQGALQLDTSQSDLLLITKSYKDVITMRKFGIYSIAPSAETIVIPEDKINRVKNFYNNVFTLFDRDRAGMILAKKYRDQYDIQPLLFNKEDEKDFSDNLKKYGVDYMVDLIQETKNLLEI